ncbi:MAG: adenylate/guanylate cyclase domain-containing protein, partial [Myxococcota bacterium]|nr:adenylate/guanylate cyclase domain-containing protein [Myxococcota bacterium]
VAARGLEKIKTIGDAYMCAGGLYPDDDPVVAASRVVNLGVELFDLLDAVIARYDVALGLRVGIHSGPLIGGVIGTRRLAYDVWGDTVNVASRMESQGLVGHVQLSQATHDLLAIDLPFEARPGLDVKGVGAMDTWVLKVR